ncbi:MAG TPA: hypothetical protein VG099_29200 [Gemmataceae bacterium]|jgi:hypothetical protein|nr:hypothetical protein [Gemmataceae bacterium]
MRWLLKRWWFWAWMAFMLVALLAGYLLIPFSEGALSQAACDRIQFGMTFEQVKSFLGDDGPGSLHETSRIVSWYDDDVNRITVAFEGRQRGVTKKEFYPTKLSFFERMKRRIERRIRAIWP